ncbi:MAG: ribosome maturation factor RimM [Nitrospiria bacterium]
MSKSFITIGKILGPVGLCGEVKIFALTDFPKRFDDLREVTVETSEGRQQTIRIDRVRYGPRYVYATFSDLASVEKVDFLRGAFIQIPEEERLPLPEGSYYQSDLIGLDVFLEDGTDLGRLEEIYETGSNDIYAVRSGKREVLIPALRKFISSVDLAQKKMVVTPVEGLIE